MQSVGPKVMFKRLIKKFAAIKKITQGKMAICGIVIRQLRVTNEFFDNGYKLLLWLNHRDVVIGPAARRSDSKELLQSLYRKIRSAQLFES